MNREVKFRAWHTEQKRMFEVYGIGPDFVTENTLDGVDPGQNAFDGSDMHFLKIMQFTGLKDKNGKEVYEGDIVQCGYGKGIVKELLGCWIVEWIDDPEAMSEFLGLDKRGRRGRKDDECFERIGNIHENHELLEAGSND